MSETATETRAQRRARERSEQEAAAAAAAGSDGSEQSEQSETPVPELTPEQKAEQEAIAAIQGYAVAGQLGEEGDASFAKETTPIRSRNPRQAAMDGVATKAYADWVAAGRPTLWQNMPVITYFLNPDDVSEYRKMIRKACDVVTPEGDATGVRVRFGKEFTLTEKMAAKIKRPDDAGKTVLAWAAVDKRHVTRGTEDN